MFEQTELSGHTIPGPIALTYLLPGALEDLFEAKAVAGAGVSEVDDNVADAVGELLEVAVLVVASNALLVLELCSSKLAKLLNSAKNGLIDTLWAGNAKVLSNPFLVFLLKLC